MKAYKSIEKRREVCMTLLEMILKRMKAYESM